MANLQGLTRTIGGFRRSLEAFGVGEIYTLPIGIAAYKSGGDFFVYVMEDLYRFVAHGSRPNGVIKKYSSTGTELARWGSIDSAPFSTMWNLIGIGVYGTEIFVWGRPNHDHSKLKILVFDLDGVYDRSVEIAVGFGTYSIAEVMLFNGKFYVAYPGLFKIDLYDTDGIYLTYWENTAQPYDVEPYWLAGDPDTGDVYAICVMYDGNVLTSDSYYTQFNSSGVILDFDYAYGNISFPHGAISDGALFFTDYPYAYRSSLTALNTFTHDALIHPNCFCSVDGNLFCVSSTGSHSSPPTVTDQKVYYLDDADLSTITSWSTA